MVISFLVPTRGRLKRVQAFVDSVLGTANFPGDIEFILYVDKDDTSYDLWNHSYQVKIVKGERRNLSQCYLWEEASGDIFVMGGDDVIFRTKGWDARVKAEFAKYPDKILLVYGDDGNPEKNGNATMPFIHRNWVKAVGRFLPPYFSGDFVDTWLTFMADKVGRKVFVPIITEHLHPAFGKREQDQTDKDRWEKHFRDDMPGKYNETLAEREADAEKLRKFMEEYV